MAQVVERLPSNLTVQSPYCLKKKENHHQVPGAHTCDPSYSGGRDEEDHSLKPARANRETLS
jgi:hypothetical protein